MTRLVDRDQNVLYRICRQAADWDKNLVTKRLPFIKVSDSLLRGKRRYE